MLAAGEGCLWPAQTEVVQAEALQTDAMPDEATWVGEGQSILQLMESRKLPTYYNSAKVGKKPTVKNQGSYGTCWALAATSALEAALLPQERMIFSADHLAFRNAFTVPVNEGGDYLMTMAYLSGWQGPVTEAEDPYGDGGSPEGLKAAVHVQEMQIYDGASPEEIKKAVQAYGAVQTSLHMNRSTVSQEETCYQAYTFAYCDPQEQVQDHDILILGWDDHFSRFLFRQVPQEDGAWICQNTWGDAFGDEGIFYVSYADRNIGRAAIAYTRVEAADNYSAVYQTDDCGWQGIQGYGDEDAWFANQYEAQETEQLAAVGFYATGEDTSYEIYLQHCSDEGELCGEKQILAAGSFLRPGYYTVDLETPVLLEEGEPFAVLVRIHTPHAENPVAVEYQADRYTQNVTLDGKHGYLSHDGETWTHTESAYGTNVCLKAYTIRNE